MGLTLAAIRRPVWVIMLMCAAMVLGWIGLRSMRVEQNPEVSFPFITIETQYFGASPDEIETLITRKIEDAISTISGLRSIRSVSVEGVSRVLAEFELSVSVDAALNDVKSKVDAIINRLPDQAEPPVVTKFDIGAEPILYLAVESETMGSLELHDFVEERVRDRLARIPGVADITVYGGDKREIRVAVHPQRLLSYGIGILDVQRALMEATMNFPSGKIKEGNREVGVRVQGEFQSVDEIRNLVIPIKDMQNPNAKPAIVRLRDIAEIKDGPAERDVISRVNGRDGVVIAIQKTREGNTVEITDKIKAEIERLEKEYPVRFVITQESAKRVKEALEDLQTALVLGIILVVGIVYLFLHNFRGTLIVALAIPTCLFAAFAAINAIGFTMNTMTMLGLSLAVGILVDDAIVVLENTYRHLTLGEPPMQAALNGRMEIGLAALSITMVDVVVFLPVAFMGGIIGQFFRPFALTVAVATLFSLLVSFTLTPMLASRWYKKGEDVEAKRGFAKWFETRFQRFAQGYRNLLDTALNRRWLVFMSGWAILFGVFMAIAGGASKSLTEALSPGIFMFFVSNGVALFVFVLSVLFRRTNVRIVVGGVLFGGVLIVAPVIGFLLAQNKGGPLLTNRFAPGVETGQITAIIEMPPDSSLERTQSVVERIEKIAATIPETEYVTSTVGVRRSGGGLAGSDTGSQYAQVIVTLKERKALIDSFMFWRPSGDLRTRSQDAITTELQQKVGKIPDAKVVISSQTGFGFGPDIQVSISGTKPENVYAGAIKAKEVLSEIPGIVNLDLSTKPGNPELRIRPDRIKLADYDISVSTLGAISRTLYEGNTDAKYREGNLEYDIRVNLADEARYNEQMMPLIPITFQQREPVYLDEIANIERATGHDKVERYDRNRTIMVTGYLLPGYVVGTVGAEIRNKLSQTNLGEGVTFALRGENEVQAREFPYLGQAFMLGLLLVFMVLAALFDNILYPFIIQLAQPQALVGALLALMITNRPLDLVGMIGFIMLVGLVGKNAILLVDYANTLRGRGFSRHDALLTSGQTRLRPVLMTTLAMILAMIPVALALGRGSEFRAPLGVVIIGGLSLSTLLTLFVIPCSYTIFDDLSNSVAGLFRRGKPKTEVAGDGEISKEMPAASQTHKEEVQPLARGEKSEG